MLITGGAGFIGANFVHHMLAQQPGVRLVVLDALTYAGSRSNLEPVAAREELRFVEGDIRDTAAVTRLMREEDIDTVVHFAAESHVDRSISGPDAFIETNVIGTHSLLKAARQLWLEEKTVPHHRFHHVSTDEVYGSLGPDDPAFAETTPYAPNSPYSASKAGSDFLVRAYHHTYGLGTTLSNCSNNYGPYQFPEKLIPLMIIHAISGKPLPVYGDGLNIRDWLHVEDHCRAIALILARGRAGETYNVGGNSERNNRQVLARLCARIDARFAADATLAARHGAAPAAAGRPTESAIQYVTDRAGHDRRYAIDATRIRAELDFEPAWNFEQGIDATVDWYLDHEAWWSPILRRL
ncbi:MAG TPA: dTDP-glucose 4,6-dehydratase [Steroidobacteraceae bacterium]|nr:dTDP-glucose 4,6-dehydratase [Steroidobacteraceae bacterium]